MRLSLVIPVAHTKTLNELIASFPTEPGFEAIFALEPGCEEEKSILEEACAKDNRLKMVLNPEHLGPMGSRINGIGHASGDVIAFADADDVLQEGYFPALEREFDSGVDAACFSFSYLKGEKKRRTWLRVARRKVVSGASAGKMLLRDLTIRGFLWAKAFRRDILLNMPCIDLRCRFEDSPFALPALCSCAKVSLIPDSLYIYRKGNGGMTSTQAAARPYERIASFAAIRHYEDAYCPELKPHSAFATVRNYLSLLMDIRLAKKEGLGKKDIKELKSDFRLICCKGLLPLEGRTYSRYLVGALPYMPIALIK